MNTSQEASMRRTEVHAISELTRLPFERPLDTYKSYPSRSLVPAHCRPWSRELEGYNPPFYESPKLKLEDRTVKPGGYADPCNVSKNEFHQWSGSGYLKSFEGPIQHDEVTGRPLNPLGRVGIQGRGVLGKWGPNHAADAIVTRVSESTGLLEVLLIQRLSGEWGLPGGMIDSGEMALEAAIRELQEETGVIMDETRPILTYQGIGDGPRITDNAWIETTAFHFQVTSDGPVARSTPKAGQDVRDAKWEVVSPELLQSLYANHGALIASALEVAHLTNPPATTLTHLQMDSLPHQPLLSNFSQLSGRIGIVGGTFDPVTYAHLLIALLAKEKCNLDSVVFIPTPQNPLKDSSAHATNRERLEMVQLALQPYKGLFVSPIELHQSQRAFTVDTLRAISEQVDPEHSSLFFIMGSDCLTTLTKWKNSREIFSYAEPIVFVRPDSIDPSCESELTRELELVFGHEWLKQLRANTLTHTLPAVSSTAIRAALRHSEYDAPYTIPNVIRYIQSRELYTV